MELFVTSIVIGILMFMGLIFWVQSNRQKISESARKKIHTHWIRLPREPKHAVLEADKILDEALKLKGYSGNLGEKLKQAGGLFSNENNVWAAHKLRNRIAHELNIKISENEAKTALHRFKQALNDLGFKLQ